MMMAAERQSFEEAVDFAIREAERKVDDAVVHAYRSEVRQIRFANSDFSAGNVSTQQCITLFVAKGKRVGAATLREVSKAEVVSAVARLAKIVSLSKPNPEYCGIAQTGFRKKEVMNTFDPRVERLTPDELAGFVREGIDGALSRGAARASGSLEAGSVREILKTTGGARCTQRGTSIAFSIRAFADKDASGHKVSCTRAMQHFKPSETGARAGELACESRAPRTLPAGKYDILFDPMAAAELLVNIGEAASIFAVESGLSFLKGRLNKTVGSDMLTVFDDGALPGGMGSTAFDAEGVPSQKTTLIRFGVLRNFLHSTSTARRYDVQTTGNAGILEPHPWNVVVEKGNYDVPELVREMRSGIYVTNSWYTRFSNYTTGEFSTIPRDAVFRVENGEIVGAVKGLRISDTMPSVLGGVEALSEAREQIIPTDSMIPVRCGHVLVRGLCVTKSMEPSAAPSERL